MSVTKAQLLKSKIERFAIANGPVAQVIDFTHWDFKISVIQLPALPFLSKIV